MNFKIKCLFIALFITLITLSTIPSFSAETVKTNESFNLIKLNNLESTYVIELLPNDLKSKCKSLQEQNSILIESSIEDHNRLKDFISTIDIPVKQVEFEVRLIELQKNRLRDLKFLRESGFLIGQISNGLSLFDFSKDTWNLFNSQISYLETLGLVQTHSYPKIVSISGRTASININTHNNVVLGSAYGAAPSLLLAQTQKLDAVKAGTNLNITPYVGDSNLITTKINVEVSNNTGTITQNGLTLPNTTFRREVDTNVQVMDGQTIAIGGLVFNNKTINRQGIPFITSIPILGDLLSNRRSNKSQSELIILITPKIKDLSSENIELKDLYYPEIENKVIKNKRKKRKSTSDILDSVNLK